MRNLKYSVLLILTAVFMFSCSSDDDVIQNNIDETEGLQLVKTLSNDDYSVEIFNKSGQFTVGYNDISLRLVDKNGDYVQDVSFDWMPMMTMNMDGMIHSHSCPFSQINKDATKQTLYNGYIVFNMESHEPDHFWDLEINFTVNGQSMQVSDTISVISTESDYNKVFTSAMGSDDVNYMLAFVEPSEPIIGTNDMVVGLFKMGENHDFPVVDGFTIKVDPRMPGMGNHSAPGNVDLTQAADGFYHGKVGFSMSGYWKINLILEDASGTVIKGEPVTEEHPESSLHFKLEF